MSEEERIHGDDFQEAVDFEDGIDQNEGVAAEYDTDAARQAGEAIAEKQEGDPRFESVPGGTAGMEDMDRAERAENAKSDPLAGLSAIERAQMEQFGTIRAGKNAGLNASDLMGKMKPKNAVQDLVTLLAKALGGDAVEEPSNDMGLDLTGPTDGEGVALPTKGNFTLVQSIGGRWKLYKFTNLNEIRGFTQQLPGLKRLFRDDGGKEYVEIDGMGRLVDR